MKTITIVIPAYQRPEMLARCLEKLGNAAFVTVTDDSPDMAMKELVEKKFAPALDTMPVAMPRIELQSWREAGINGLDRISDDDCEPQSGWLDIILFAADGTDIAEGKTVCPEPHDDPFEGHVENLDGSVLRSCNLSLARYADFPKSAV
jgi:mycofactocin glycosyltransferase